MAPRHRYDIGIIGNCSYMAHIDARANVVWMCWPRFDSPCLFGGLLDDEKGGVFAIEPATDRFESRQYYLENTNVLVTEFTCDDGRFRVIDLAPRFEQYERTYKPLMLMRKIERLEGAPRVRVRCRPVGDYGAVQPKPQLGSNHIRYPGLGDSVRLTTDVPLTRVMDEQPFKLTEDRACCLTWGVPLDAPLNSPLDRFLRATVRFWRAWVEDCTVPNFAQEQVIRSALVLKMHQYQDTGAIIAAGTTSLPESPGSTRNWDYRYCWLRDTFYTLSAFDHIGHFEEMKKFADFVQNLVSDGRPRVQPVYAIDGSSALVESTLDLAGYLGNQPVRVGNQAYEHIQNDAYGQILLSLLPLYTDRRFVAAERMNDTKLIGALLDRIRDTMDEPDAGLWELRGMAWKHCYTFLFHWAGANAASQIAVELGDKALERRAKSLAVAAAKQIEACHNDELGTYGHAIGSNHMDASTLQLISLQYLDPRGDRAQKLLEVVEEKLLVRPGFLYRYNHADDFGMPEVAFLVCGFWYVDALACAGRIDDAIEAFEGIMNAANPLGLISEDADPRDDSQWGNFPQTYSHVGVINTAFRIAQRLEQPRFLATGAGARASGKELRQRRQL